MLQSKARVLQLNAKLAETLTSKGVTATADETTTALVNKVGNITSGDDSVLRGLIQRDLTEIVIPDGINKIGHYAFSDCTKLTSVKIPDSVTQIGASAFSTCESLINVEIPDSVIDFGGNVFANCKNLTNVNIPKKMKNLPGWLFGNCTSLKSITLPNSLENASGATFNGCKNLEFITLDDGFNANNLNLSVSTLYSRETILQWLNALADRTGQTANKLSMGATNLAKLTEEDILIATSKNWTLA